ncbi:transporter substrate-binding protein [Hoeflea sp. G2-23]|uniref:Transporter substrate-binding protein n=1 Tax=Hoeflea algicola TaxID=2983763 RepID=A0ABT3ZAK9_9HYPH|nr:transporter substrate-binding protein [Hoeflea algicola]MCY0148826.1 transporter substrate-binding protein [Hoeflea algicola]
MMKRNIEIGLLHSRSGDYSALAMVARTGILRGVAEINADPALDVGFSVVERDPEGRLDRYAPLCRDMLQNTGVRHIFGCITSSSRKEVIPELERFHGALWYSAPYEGFEANEHVAYTHSCPNQHLLPLLEFATPRFGNQVCLVGSNYIWGWEIAQIAREKISTLGGQILSDRYLPIGDTGLDQILEEIRALQPDFVVNSLIGESSYSFLARLGKMRAEAGNAEMLPVLSCNFTEGEIAAAGTAAEGMYAAGPFFEQDVVGHGSIAEMSRLAVHELAGYLNANPGAEMLPLTDLIALAAKQGRPLRLDSENQHASQPVVIAQLRGRKFEEILRLPEIAADPYWTRRDRSSLPRSNLRVVS